MPTHGEDRCDSDTACDETPTGATNGSAEAEVLGDTEPKPPERATITVTGRGCSVLPMLSARYCQEDSRGGGVLVLEAEAALR